MMPDRQRGLVTGGINLRPRPGSERPGRLPRGQHRVPGPRGKAGKDPDHDIVETPEPKVGIYRGFVGAALFSQAVNLARHDDEVHAAQALATPFAVGGGHEPGGVVADVLNPEVEERVEQITARDPGAVPHQASRRQRYAKGPSQPAVQHASGWCLRSAVTEPAPGPPRALGAEGVENAGEAGHRWGTPRLAVRHVRLPTERPSSRNRTSSTATVWCSAA